MCNIPVFQQYVSSLNICGSDEQFCVTHSLWQSALAITILYRSSYPLHAAPRLYRCLRAQFAKKYHNCPFIKTFHKRHLRRTCNKLYVKTLYFYVPAAHLSAAVTASGILWDTINRTGRSVYCMYCKWHRLLLCAVNYFVLSLFFIFTVLCIAICKIKELYWNVIFLWCDYMQSCAA